jgi:hypothetical protein
MSQANYLLLTSNKNVSLKGESQLIFKKTEHSTKISAFKHVNRQQLSSSSVMEVEEAINEEGTDVAWMYFKEVFMLPRLSKNLRIHSIYFRRLQMCLQDYRIQTSSISVAAAVTVMSSSSNHHFNPLHFPNIQLDSITVS